MATSHTQSGGRARKRGMAATPRHGAEEPLDVSSRYCGERITLKPTHAAAITALAGTLMALGT